MVMSNSIKTFYNFICYLATATTKKRIAFSLRKLFLV
jgi:hypothetical protein